MKKKPTSHELIQLFPVDRGRAIDRVLEDVNFLIRALAKQLCGNPNEHTQLRKLLMDFEVKNSKEFGKLCVSINSMSFAEHVETRKKVFTWGSTVEIFFSS